MRRALVLALTSCILLVSTILAGCTTAPNTRPTASTSTGHVRLAVYVDTGHGSAAVTPEELGAMVGRAAEEFAVAGVDLEVVSVQYIDARDADARTRKGRRSLAARTPAGAVPVAFVRHAGRRTRGKWIPRDGVVVVGATATPTTLSHELGHAFGLDHHEDPTNIMCSCDRRGTPTFTRAQRDQIRVAAAPQRSMGSARADRASR